MPIPFNADTLIHLYRANNWIEIDVYVSRAWRDTLSASLFAMGVLDNVYSTSSPDHKYPSFVYTWKSSVMAQTHIHDDRLMPDSLAVWYDAKQYDRSVIVDLSKKQLVPLLWRFFTCDVRVVAPSVSQALRKPSRFIL